MFREEYSNYLLTWKPDTLIRVIFQCIGHICNYLAGSYELNNTRP